MLCYLEEFHLNSACRPVWNNAGYTYVCICGRLSGMEWNALISYVCVVSRTLTHSHVSEVQLLRISTWLEEILHFTYGERERGG